MKKNFKKWIYSLGIPVLLFCGAYAIDKYLPKKSSNINTISKLEAPGNLRISEGNIEDRMGNTTEERVKYNNVQEWLDAREVALRGYETTPARPGTPGNLRIKNYLREDNSINY